MRGFTAKYFHEHLAEHHSFGWVTAGAKRICGTAGISGRRRRVGANRRTRPGTEIPGMMVLNKKLSVLTPYWMPESR